MASGDDGGRWCRHGPTTTAEHWGAGVEHQRLRAVGVGGGGQEKGSERKRD
jgi:hypothetical protein